MKTKRKSTAEKNRQRKKKYEIDKKHMLQDNSKQIRSDKKVKERQIKKKEFIRRIRSNLSYLEMERAKNRKRIRELRKNKAYRKEQNKKNQLRMAFLRKQKQFIETERQRNIVRNRILRTRVQYIEQEMLKNKQRNKILRKKPSYRRKEMDQNIIRNKLLRKSLTYAKNEIEKNINRNKQLRKREQYKQNEIAQNMQRMRMTRFKQTYKLKEQSNNKLRMRCRRQNRKHRNKEMKQKVQAQRKNRLNDIMKFRENLQKHLLYSKNDDPTAEVKLKFIKFRSETPSYICCCCEGLFFRTALTKLNELRIKSTGGSQLFAQINNFPSGLICCSCKIYAYSKGTVYKLSTQNGLKFQNIPKCIEELTDLEERMVAPVLNFMQIRALKPYALNPQLGLKGSVVNIPIEINDMLQVLPRRFDQMQTIQIQLKRHIDHKSSYMFESVRPAKIIEALKYLITTPLYKKYAVKIDEKFANYYEDHINHEQTIDFIVDTADIDIDHEGRNNQTVPRQMDAKYEQIINLSQINDDEVLLINNNTDLIREGEPEIKIIAPGQNKKPLPWHQIEDLDELCFPKIFAGHAFNLPKCITYTDRVKSEVRRYDRRSCTPARILFMAKKSLEISCLSSINICLRRIKRSTHGTMMVKDALNHDYLNDMIKFDDGFRMLKNVRSSPAFWEQKKKDLLAMIRQLGKPTLFLTLSAGERYWPELLQTLMKYSKEGRTISKEEAYNLDDNITTDLIRNDPVTCARYFDYKVQKFMWLLKQNHGIFGEYVLVDSYQRVEFQQRGSPHEHMLLWLKNAPQYDDENDENNEQLINFIDKFLTCENDETNPYTQFQTHRHTHTCYKGQKNKKCRFNIPYPVMKKTMILKPLQKTQIAPKSYESVDVLMQELASKNIVMSYDDILKKLNMTEHEYIMAIRSTLKQKRVFLKRSSQELAINSYNKDISQLFESNIDLQFILDEYAVISYVTNYISKIEGGLSKLLREAAEDCDNNNSTIKDKFRKITNTFLNSNLMSAQEAAYHVLSLSLSKKSRKTIFINTGPIAERVLMLKRNAELKKLDEESTDIYMDDVFDKYAKREKILEDICLAEYAASCHLSKKKLQAKYDECEDENDEINTNKFRQHMAVIRYRRYKFHQDPANYFREKILLFLPWRNEETEIENVVYETVYKQHKAIIEMNQTKFAIISDEAIDDVLEQFENDTRDNESEKVYSKNSTSHCVDILCQGGEDYKTHANPQKNEYNGNNIQNRYVSPARVKEDELHDMMIKLNSKQREFVMHILKCYKTSQTPFRIFLSGSAGVGKSTVINTLYQLITNYFDKLPGGDMDKMIVLLCATSGKAAFLINGITLHTAFSLPRQEFGNIVELSSDIANTIREKLSKLQLIIIDEISMVPSTIFGFVDTRMRQIKGVDKPFGGVSVLAVGDLNQLPPVLDKPVYQISKKNRMAAFMDINPLWEPFQFYELTEIMRQKDDLAFINALNNLSLGKMTKDDISLIKTREVAHDIYVPPTAIRLYATRANVATYNARKIAECPSELFIADAENIFSNKNISEQMKKMILQSLRTNPGTNDLPAKIQLKVDIKYMIMNNVDVEDGLVNGACGVLKLITFKENTNIPEILWLDFQVSRVGNKARSRYKDLMKKENINLSLTPVTKVCLQLTKISDEKHQILRKQFPVVPAEAITIHKSQGQTYDKICLDFKKHERRTQQMLYVALSRVPKLSGLYILGKLSLPESCYLMKTMTPALVELTRLRNHKQLVLSYDNLVDIGGLKISYQNIGTLKSKLKHILHDEWFLRNDILIFSETLAKNSDQLSIANYEILYKSTYSFKSRGFICYVKDHLDVEHIYSQQEFTTESNMEAILLKVGDIYVISGYKSPKATKEMFETVIRKFLDQIPNESNILVLGDFNFDVRNTKNDGNYLINYMRQYHLNTQLSPADVTTNMNTQIDVIFSNMKNIHCGIYETYFSYHKPIHAILNPTNKIVANNNNIIAERLKNENDNEINTGNNNDESNKREITDTTTTSMNTHDYRKREDCLIVNVNESQLAEQKCEEEVYNFALPPDQCQEIINYNYYVQDKHMNFFQEIMNKTLHERGINNFAQKTAYAGFFPQHLERVQRYKSNIQILYTSEIGPDKVDHWVCTKADGKGNIHVYDSLNSNSLNNDQINYLQAIYKYKAKYKFHKVPNQRNSFESGVFAIYFATLLSYGEDPSKSNYYDVQLMRNHISKMLLQKTLFAFPNRIDAPIIVVQDDGNDEKGNCHMTNMDKGTLVTRYCRNDEYNFALAPEACREVLQPNAYLQDRHINSFHEIMNKTLNERGVGNLAQDTGYVGVFLRNLEKIPIYKSNIQILYTGKIAPYAIGHWICTKADGEGNIHIYDSFNSNCLHQDQLDYLNAIYNYNKKYIFHKVQNQANYTDCGVFAIYFATLLCYNINPSQQNYYEVRLMRTHITEMLLQKKLLPLPNLNNQQ